MQLDGGWAQRSWRGVVPLRLEIQVEALQAIRDGPAKNGVDAARCL
jgi:hypothetical protein